MLFSKGHHPTVDEERLSVVLSEGTHSERMEILRVVQGTSRCEGGKETEKKQYYRF